MPDVPAPARPSYSAHGEDRVLLALYEELGGLPASGCYVDVGAYHPVALSNTAVLYEAGWWGINIEPNPVMARFLREMRRGDITLCQAAGTPARTADLLFFGDWASSNTLDPDFASWISSEQDVQIEQRISTPVIPLADVFAEHLPAGRGIDVLSVDVEGMDAEVLRSNDWGRYRPHVVMVEDLALRLDDVAGSEVFDVLSAAGYRLVSHAVKTSFYIDDAREAGRGS